MRTVGGEKYLSVEIIYSAPFVFVFLQISILKHFIVREKNGKLTV